jgi:hypothetical protein
MPNAPVLPPVVHALAEEALGLATLIAQSETAQWQPANIPKPRDDSGIRAKGGHADPVSDTVADERRLALRAQVVAGELLLRSATRAMRAISRRLERALAAGQ